MRPTTLLAAAALTATAGPLLAQTKTITYQGVLEEGDRAYSSGTASIGFFMSDSPDGSNVLATAAPTNIEVDPQTGFFTAFPTLNQATGQAKAFGEGPRYLGVMVNGEVMTPLSPWRPAPLADDIAESAKSWQVYGPNAGFLRPGYAAIGAVTIHKNTGRIGVGTTTPVAPLDVRGDVVIQSNGRLGVGTGAPLAPLDVRGNVLIQNNGRLGIGTTSPLAPLHVNGRIRTNVLDIIGGSDIAEPFQVSGEPLPGMVVRIDPDNVGQLALSDTAYDRRVAGVISGAGGVNTGLTLTQNDRPETVGDHPVALTGRVWCYVDADTNGAVRAGDLLTTSPIAGHAMKALDHDRANGAIIGKAMSNLDSGTGLVFVLVNLQ